MRIQHNIPAMSAYRNYTNNVSAMKKNLEKLSSGYKINRAGDDAAGLAISEKMRAQITGLQVAQKNAKDGISLVQTAEGALTEVHDMLNRMYSLAEQSANGTYDNEVDRVQLQKEIDSLSTEINRISESANFNGIKLLNGDQGAKSLSALGETATVVKDSAINGTNPSAAGAAEITVDLRSSAAVNGEVLKSNTDNDVDGSDLAPATKAEFTITVGGVKGDTTAKIKFTGQIGGNAVATATENLDMTAAGWQAGDYIEFEAGGQTYKFSHGAKDGYIDASAGLATELTKAGFTGPAGTTATESIKITAASDTTGFDGTDKIQVGTTEYKDILGFKVDNQKLGDLFTIKVNGAEVASTTATKFANGDVITLEAKQAGKMDETNNKAFDKLSSLTGGAPAGAAGDAATALASKVEATNGKDVDYAAPAVTPTKYDISIDLAKLQGGQEIRIGTNKIKFTVAGATATTAVDKTSAADTDPDHGYKVYTVNLNDSTVATSLDTIMDDIFNAANGFDAAKTVSSTTGTKFSYKAESKTDAGEITKANLGEVRVFEANKDGTTDITAANKAVTSTYAPSKEPAAGATNAPFAKVEYTIKEDMIKAGNKVTIGGKEIEFVASGKTDLAKGQVAVDAVAANLAKALEQQGYTSGKVTAAADGNDIKLTIEGTKVGESAADLKADAGKVTFLDKAKAGPNIVTTDDGDFKIEVGKTKVSDLLETELVAATGGNEAKTLGDLFRITDANGRELKADSVIADGQTIKFVAKDKGKLSDDIMDKLAFNTGEANITIKNGWDEGTAAAGDKTHYELQFNLNNLRGGQTFTFGTDTSSVTFEITFDDVTTKNGTVNDENNTNLDGTADDHVKIDLGGLTTDAEKIKAIVDAVTDEMDKFDVSYSATAGKMTLMMDGKQEWKADTNDTNLGNVRVSSNNNALSATVYNPAGGAAAGTPGTYAQIAYEFDVSKLQEGDALTVGDTTVYFGKEAKVEKDGNGSKITVALEDAKSDTNLITQALESAGYRGGKVEFSDGKVTITGVETGETADHLKGNLGKITVGTTTNRAMSEGGLKLQIGDTADPYNQMVVDIKNCSTSAMGLDGLNIGSQTNAIDAMAKIKNAINYVSDIRGGLGATQNRLDHTINNLSVMQENIQDAESSIRDVDVAEEMMAYTKNNILIQSAQAMLAQANQLPQGVLQLLG